jgi:hypothetical protein
MTNQLNGSEFIAEAILTQLRNNIVPTDDEAAYMDRFPLIDALRNRVTASDLPWLLMWVQSRTDIVAGLACSLLSQHAEVETVGECIRKQWPSATPYLKNRLMWRLLDDRSLEGSWLPVFRQFILDHWDVFETFNRPFFGPPERSLETLLSRLTNPRSPLTKRWVYLWCAPCVLDNQETVESIIRIGLLHNDPTMHTVAQEVHDKLPSLRKQCCP